MNPLTKKDIVVNMNFIRLIPVDRMLGAKQLLKSKLCYCHSTNNNKICRNCRAVDEAFDIEEEKNG